MMIATTIREKRKAFATMAKSELDTIEKPRTIANAAPSAAPDATPNVKGETNGFPKQPCIKAPAVARAAPPTIAIKILGKRSFQMIADCNSSADSIPKRIFMVVNKSRLLDEPHPIAKIANNKVATQRIKIIMICDFEFWMCFSEIESITST